MTIREHPIEVVDWTIHRNLPLIYLWEILDSEKEVIRYIGKSQGGHHRPTIAYKEKLEGNRKSPWREVHHALDSAIKKNQKIRLTLFCNVADDHLKEMEKLLIGAFRSDTKNGGLNRA